MLDSRELVKKLTANLEVLASERISPSGQKVLSQCRTICSQLKDPEPFAKVPSLVPSVSKQSETILIVDDDDDTVRVLEFIFKDEGFTVHSVTNAQDVMGALDDYRPEILLMELRMPSLPSVELLPRIKNHPIHGNVKVIIGSSRTFDRDRETVLKLGASDFVSKPFHMEELVLRIRALVS